MSDPMLIAQKEPAFELHLAEYAALRAEIVARQAVRAQSLQLGVAGIVAIWAFLATKGVSSEVQPLISLAWWLPVAVALVGLGLNYVESIGVSQAGAYLAMIEERFADPAIGGWENTLIRMRKRCCLTERIISKDNDADKDLTVIRKLMKSREPLAGVSEVLRVIWLLVAALAAVVAIYANDRIDHVQSNIDMPSITATPLTE